MRALVSNGLLYSAIKGSLDNLFPVLKAVFFLCISLRQRGCLFIKFAIRETVNIVSLTDSNVPSHTTTLARRFMKAAMSFDGRVDERRERSSTRKNLALVSWSTVEKTEITSTKL